jgi:hypothetical protein
MTPKVAVVTAWRYRDHFVPIYNEIWSKQLYPNYKIHIFEENYTLATKTNKFHHDFNVHAIDANYRMSIGAKLNYAFDKLAYDYDYMMLSSSDDYYAPEYIKTCVKFMVDNNLDLINMKQAYYLNLKNMHICKINTSASYSGMFFFRSKLAQKYRWNESLRAGEDRFMLNMWKNAGTKYQATNIHQPYWLGLLHNPKGGEGTGNWNTYGHNWRWKSIDTSWLRDYLNNDVLFNLYTNIVG